MLTWDIVTEKLETEAREAEMAADTAAVNQLLLALGRATTERRGDHARRSTTIREAFGWSYGDVLGGRPEAEHVLKFAPDSGTVGEEFRRVYPRGASSAKGRG